MNPSEAATLLAMAATLDPRLNPPSAEDAQARAQAWAATLDSDMSINDGKRMLITHYRENTTGVMPAHINRLWREHRRTTATHQRESNEKQTQKELEALAVPMPQAVREQLKTILGKKP